MMSKEFAREKIEEYLSNNGGVLPIKDAVVLRIETLCGWQEFTFKHLLCVAYDLQPEN